MKTFQDLLLVGENDKDRVLFCRGAINEFKSSQQYKEASAAEAYYAKRNLTIEAFQKMLMTVSGRKVQDVWSANYKLKSQFFRRMVIQQTQYLLGNGMTLNKETNKDKLGDNFDYKLQEAAKRALVGGVAFGMWDIDHVDIFGLADTATSAGFCPLYDEQTAKLRAGIRYWYKQVDNISVLIGTLYEEDGFTKFTIDNEDNYEITQAKRAYKVTVQQNEAGDVESEISENYTSLPIVPLYGNDVHQSELVGLRENIDCYDFVKSGLANEIDDTTSMYWILENTGGMDDTDLAQFVQRMKTVHAAVVDGDGNAKATANTIDIPVDARDRMLQILREDLYDDAQLVDVKSLSSGNKTATEIMAAYQPQDNKVDDFEYNVIEFCKGIFELAGIDDEPSFVRSKVVNLAETTNNVLAAANYLDDEAVLKHLPWLTPEEVDEILKRKAGEDMTRMGVNNFGRGDEDDEIEVDEEDDVR